MAWQKIGTRYYDKVDGQVLKSTYDSNREEYVLCGEWTEAEFSAHTLTFDQNSETEYNNIKTALSIT